MFKAIKDPQFCIAIPLYHEQGIFNYITTGTFTPVGNLPLCLSQYSEAIFSDELHGPFRSLVKSSLLKKLHLRAQ
jgi:hypothetical protein